MAYRAQRPVLTDPVAGWQISLKKLLWHNSNYAHLHRLSPIAGAGFGFSVGAVLLALPWSNQQLAVIGWLAPAALVLVCCLSRVWLSPQLRCFVPALLIGLLYANLHAQWSLAARIPLCADEHYRDLAALETAGRESRTTSSSR